MLLARAILGIGIGGFWAIAVGLGTHLVPAEIGQRATSVIFGGISIGTIVGVPAGPLLGHLFGGRSAFLIVAALGLLPRIRVEKVTTLSSLTTLVKSRNARVGLTITFFTITAQFTTYTSVAPFLEQQTGASAGLISTVLLAFAIAGIVGNFATATPSASGCSAPCSR
jgi:predicted MFS family arabinose efflux permease